MRREKALLERLADAGSARTVATGGTTVEDLEELMESVRRHLRRLMNSRQGISEAQMDYGLPALTDMTVGSGDYVRNLVDAIRSTIEKYEPRLRGVRVTMRDDVSTAQTLVFRVEAVLVSRSGEHRVWYETAVRASGQFDVEG